MRCLTTRCGGPWNSVGRVRPRHRRRCRPLNSIVSQRMNTAARKRSIRSKRASARAEVTFDEVREIAHKLPGVEDGTSYGTAALKVRGKLFVRLHQSGECFVLRSTILDREIMMQANPEAFFLTDHYLGYPWILVRFSGIRKSDLPELLERAWRLIAPKSLIAQRNENVE